MNPFYHIALMMQQNLPPSGTILTMSSKFTYKDIITLPNPNLRKHSQKVTVIDDVTTQTISDMMAATLDWEASRPHEVAVALAAVQIDRLQRIVIIREDFDDKDNKNFTILINPKITKYEGHIEYDQEGCLSVKDIYGNVPRYTKVRIRAQTPNERGELVDVKFKSPNPFLARVLQHEIDHTNGICFVDRIARDHDAFSILTESGELKPITYDEVESMNVLPTDPDYIHECAALYSIHR